MARHGRRRGLSLGYLIGGAGGIVALLATGASALVALLAGLFVMGLGNSATQLARYAAAELYPPHRRGAALSWIVWAGTVGAVVGPNLVAPAGRLVDALGMPALAGGYLVAGAFFLAAAALSRLTLRPAPVAVDRAVPAGIAGLAAVLAERHVRIALAALVTGHVVMVLIMTMTPLHVQAAGHGLHTVGVVFSAHTLGMFAVAPVTGRLTDRLGPATVILAGEALLALAAVLAATAPASGRLLTLALFLLGLGWNFGFVAGSALLTLGLPFAERARLQGFTDAAIWASAAVASLVSGALLALVGYALLCLLAAALVALPAVAVVAGRGSLNRLAV
jgi:MFS family permease